MKKIYHVWVFALALVLQTAFVGYAQEHRAHVASQGGGISEGGGYTLFSVIGGEPVEQELSGADFKGQAGFLFKGFENMLPQYVIRGNVITPEGDSLRKGMVALLKDKDGTKEQIASTALLKDGSFSFQEVYTGTYTIKIIPVADTGLAHRLLTTYLGGTQLPHTSTVFNLTADSSFTNLRVLREQAPDSAWLGLSAISGVLVAGSSGERPQNRLMAGMHAHAGIPITNAQVFLTDPATREIKFATLTDNKGIFNFKDIASRSYGLLVEHEGKTFEMSEVIDVSQQHASAAVTAVITNGEINTSVEVVASANLKTAKGFLLYPNPVAEKLIIYITGLAAGPAEISVHDIHGKLITAIKTMVSGSRLGEEIDFKEFPPGFYMVAVQQGNFIKHSKVIKQ